MAKKNYYIPFCERPPLYKQHLIREIGGQVNGRGSGMWCQWRCTCEPQITGNPAFLHCYFIVTMQNTYTPDANIIIQFIKGLFE